MSKTVLLSGIAGFVGHHGLEHIMETTDWNVVGLTTFRHMGDPLRLELNAYDPERIKIFHVDLTSDISPRVIDRIGPVDYIFNYGSMSHVDHSIEDPRPFVENNVSLMITMLEAARVFKPEMFIQVGTDEELGPAPDGVNYKEWDRVIPSNPYAASKAAQSALGIAWWRTYGVPVVLTQTMNMFGERQDPVKYIPSVIAKVYRGGTVTVHGNEDRIGSRFYLHARNHASAMVYIAQNLPASAYDEVAVDRPDRYNIRGEQEIDNLALAHMIADIMGKPLKYELLDFHSARPGHDRRYALDDEKLKALGWVPPVPLKESLERVVDWTLRNPEWLM